MLNAFQNKPLTLIKLGGSLFDMPGLATRLLGFLDQHQFESPLIIPGGGKFADEVRSLDQQQNLGNILSHELGIRTLAISSRFVVGLSEKFYLATPNDLPDINATLARYPIADVSEFVLEHCPLPNSWDVTSDSIAGWMTSLHPGSHLVLLKSLPLPDGISLSQAAELNLVDAEFPRVASTLKRLSWCHFRSDEQKLIHWKMASKNSQLS